MSRRFMTFLMFATLISCSNEGSGPQSQPASLAEQSSQDAERLQKTNPGSGPTREAWRSEYETMTSALSLSEEEKARLAAALKTRDETIAQWMAEKGNQLKDLERQMAEAARARDLASVKDLTERAHPLRSELRAQIASQTTAVRGVLSADNQLNWDAHQLAQRVLKVMQPLNLTEPQRAQLRAESITAAQAAVQEPNPSAAGYLKLERSVEANVLTAEQRSQFIAVKKKHPLRSLK